MALPKPTPNQAELLKRLLYDPVNGSFTWIYGKPAGKKAGSTKHRCLRININGVLYNAHRVAWKMMTGVDPTHLIDHINGNPYDNRWENLREADTRQNAYNSYGVKNKIGVRGVRASGPKWRATIRTPTARINLGTFDTIEEASNAYKSAAAELHQSFFKS